jgi:GNAT superfamily N-acetyltransferase
MEIVDLTEELVPLYCVCLEDWSPELAEAGDHKRRWYERMKGKGLRVKLALDDRREVGGMIHYAPIEETFVEGKDLCLVYCVWVHGYEKGRGNFQGKGMGRALLEAAEEDAHARGAKGMVAWGLDLPFFLRASWFRKQGYRTADRLGGFQALVWKPFAADAVKPRWLRPKRRPQTTPGKVTVTALVNGWCPAQSLACERAKRAAAAFGEKALFREVDTLDHATLLEWGSGDALFIDRKTVRTGPPPTYETLYKKIARRVRRLGP